MDCSNAEWLNKILWKTHELVQHWVLTPKLEVLSLGQNEWWAIPATEQSINDKESQRERERESIKSESIIKLSTSTVIATTAAHTHTHTWGDQESESIIKLSTSTVISTTAAHTHTHTLTDTHVTAHIVAHTEKEVKWKRRQPREGDLKNNHLYLHTLYMPPATGINAPCVPVHCNIECGYNDSHRARHVSSRCDIYKVAKVVHGNWSESYCTHSDTLPSILPEFC